MNRPRGNPATSGRIHNVMAVQVVAAFELPSPVARADDLLVHGDTLDVLPLLPDGAFDVIYIDPPFNTGSRQVNATLRAVADPDGTRTGFNGRRYRTEDVGPRMAYEDRFEDLPAYLEPRLVEARRLLADHG